MKKTVRRLVIKLTRLLIDMVGGGIDVQDAGVMGKPVAREGLMPLDEYKVPITEGRFRASAPTSARKHSPTRATAEMTRPT